MSVRINHVAITGDRYVMTARLHEAFACHHFTKIQGVDRDTGNGGAR